MGSAGRASRSISPRRTYSPLPGFEPGAHIDLHLPNGVMRQYSLCGDHSDTSRYRIAIRSVSGGLSSQFIHRKLRPGEQANGTVM